MQRTVLSQTNCGEIRLQYIMALFARGVPSSVFRAFSGGEENDTSDTHDPIWGGSQVNVPPKFHSEIGVCIVLVYLLRGIAKESNLEAV